MGYLQSEGLNIKLILFPVQPFQTDQLRLDGFLFRENKLCVPNCSMRELLVQESHGEGLMGHFGVAKTLAILQEHFYWHHMK